MSDAPIHPSGHPARHGFLQCSRCGTWRKLEHLAMGVEESAVYLKWLASGGDKPEVGSVFCIEVGWCSEQAKASGRLEGP